MFGWIRKFPGPVRVKTFFIDVLKRFYWRVSKQANPAERETKMGDGGPAASGRRDDAGDLRLDPCRCHLLSYAHGVHTYRGTSTLHYVSSQVWNKLKSCIIYLPSLLQNMRFLQDITAMIT